MMGVMNHARTNFAWTFEDEEARGIAGFKRRLGNQFRWQVVVEIAYLQAIVHKPVPFPPLACANPRC